MSEEALAGNILKHLILKQLNEWYLLLSLLWGEAHHGAGALAGYSKGVTTHILNKFPKALYTHYAAHRLNLCAVKCCSIREKTI